MAKKQSGLGKGLGALMLENNTDSMVSTDTLAVNDIIPNKEQPRKTFDEAALQELADSIKQHGVLRIRISGGDTCREPALLMG